MPLTEFDPTSCLYRALVNTQVNMINTLQIFKVFMCRVREEAQTPTVGLKELFVSNNESRVPFNAAPCTLICATKYQHFVGPKQTFTCISGSHSFP